MEVVRKQLVKFCLALLVITCFTSCKETILHNLSEIDANRIISELHIKLLTSEKIKQADGLWSIAVDKSQSLEALAVLNASRIIKEQPKLKSNNTSIMSSREEQLFQFERALSQEIEFTLASLPGVLETRVHLNLPVRDPLFAQQLESIDLATASVMLIVNESFKSKASDIQALVGGAAGILKDQISVLINVVPAPKSAATKLKNPVNQTVDPNILLASDSSKKILPSSLLIQNLYSQLAFSLLIICACYGLYILKRKNKKILDLKELYSQK